MMKMVERDIGIFINEGGGFLVTEDFKVKFYKFIVNHYLRKFHCFHLQLDTSKHFLCLNTAIYGEYRARVSEESQEEQASGEPQASSSGGEAIELEQKSKKMFNRLRNLMPKFHRRERE